MTRKRRSFSAADKAAAVRRHLVEKIPVSEIADQSKTNRPLNDLREKLITKNEVCAELMEENIRSRKDNGEL
jgi:hypothetical protein